MSRNILTILSGILLISCASTSNWTDNIVHSDSAPGYVETQSRTEQPKIEQFVHSDDVQNVDKPHPEIKIIPAPSFRSIDFNAVSLGIDENERLFYNKSHIAPLNGPNGITLIVLVLFIGRVLLKKMIKSCLG